MVKLESFDVRLDRFDGQYAAGDNVTGSLYLSVSSKHSVKIKDLSVTLTGEAKTSWVNKVSDNIYDSTEPYLNLKQTFRHLLDTIVDSRGQLPSGSHRFPFKFFLPTTLPSSYEGEFGYIRYSCVAEVNAMGGDMQRATSFRAGFSSKNKKISIEKAISIIAQVGVNELSPNGNVDTGLRKEGGYETSGCCGVGVGRINAAITIQKSAIVLGQSMLVEVWLENQMRNQLRSPALVSLVQDVHFRSVSFFQTASDSKTVSRIVDSVNVDIPERGKDQTRTISIGIPADLPATSSNETLITIRYTLRLEVGHFEIVLPIGLASKV